MTPEIAQPLSSTRSAELAREAEQTLSIPRRSYGLLARLLFWTMDLLYGRKRTVEKFKVLELIARVPYQAWEQVGYVAATHTHRKPSFAGRIFEFVRESREQQDNEMWHLLILQELLQKRGFRDGLLRFRVIPQLIALAYYHVSWILYVLKPAWSYRLNADFEDHAEHEYMLFAQENPSFEREPFESEFSAQYGTFESLADLMRQIGVDERHHKNQSLARIARARFA
jgi:hypothetical protein